MKNIFSFLREDSKVSSIRLTLFIATLGFVILVLGVLAYLIIASVKGKPIDWQGCAIFVGAISALLGITGATKVMQKGKEGK